jgi:hypothetical protein
MKKLLLVIVMMIVSVTSNAQNLIGHSWSDVYQNMDSNGHIINKGVTKDNVQCIMAIDNGTIRLYYFTPNNLCYLYVYAVKNTTFEQYEKYLFDEGYVRMGTKFYKGEFSAEIKWNQKLLTYTTGITYK